MNISTRMPPEILGCIFAWSLARQPGRLLRSPHFDGLPKGSYNFLLVCHHWFEVACRTPELWSFWGTTLQNWQKLHRRSGTSTLDLVLNGYECGPAVHFDGSLQSSVVRARAVQNAIRQVHLRLDSSETMASIISSLTPGDDEATQNQNIESIVWENEGAPPVDISDFFTRSRLSKLCLLHLTGDFRISSWDRLSSLSTFLTVLSLQIEESPQIPSPTTSQLFSVLATYPNLRQLALSGAAIPNNTDGSTLKMPLRNLKLFSLTGEFRPIFGSLRRLILPQMLDNMKQTVFTRISGL